MVFLFSGKRLGFMIMILFQIGMYIICYEVYAIKIVTVGDIAGGPKT